MNTALAAGTMATHASADACYHCGETLPANAARIQMDGVTHQFCCDGCAAAAALEFR